MSASSSPLQLLDAMSALRAHLRRQWAPVRVLMEVVPIEYPLRCNVVAAGAYEPGRLNTEVFLVTPRGWRRVFTYHYWKRVENENDARRALRDAAQREAMKWVAR